MRFAWRRTAANTQSSDPHERERKDREVNLETLRTSLPDRPRNDVRSAEQLKKAIRQSLRRISNLSGAIEGAAPGSSESDVAIIVWDLLTALEFEDAGVTEAREFIKSNAAPGRRRLARQHEERERVARYCEELRAAARQRAEQRLK